MVELHFSLVYLLAKLHFFLIFLLTKLHFSLFWLLEKLHFFLISKFRGVLPSYYRSGGMAKLKTRGRRVEVLRGGTPERFVAKTFTVSVRPEVKAFFATPRLKKGGAYSKTCATLHEKRKTAEKYKKEPRARRAISPFIPIRFSRVHAFPPNPTQFGFKVW